MSRQIKFRVWDKMEQRYTMPDVGYQGHYVLALNGSFHNLQNGVGGDEVVVEQFTGLQDKNGVDIYEGDIIKIYNHPQVEKVEYEMNGSSFGFFLHDSKTRDSGAFENLSDYTGSDGYEIVGNIHQNPELL